MPLRFGLLRNLTGGARLLGLRRLPPERFAGGFDQLAALLLLDLLVWAALDTLHAESGSRLMLDGLYGWALYLLLGLIACALVARAYCHRADTRSLLIPVLSVAPYVLVIFWLASDRSELRDRPTLEIILAVGFLLLLSIRLQQAAYGSARPKALLLAAIFILAASWVLRTLDLDTRLWLTDDTEEAQADDALAEPILYDQPGRIVAAVEHMPAREPGQAAVFYVGFAGDGEQEIFKRESLYGEQVFAEHFRSGDRALELINDDDDRDSFPIASVSGLQQALKLIASKMDTQQDVLVLLLTSHGSRDGLAVVNGTLPLLQLAPADLRAALDEAGIKWRVVVVSACYAGVFVDALKNDSTLVVSAADAQHSSFGCEDDRDLTWFGEAFLHDAIPKTRTLEQAFRLAAQLIEHRETGEHEIHSNPQMFVGARMHAKLAELEDAEAAARQGTIVANHRGNTLFGH